MPRAEPALAARARGGLLGLAAGNALGLPAEGLTAAEVAAAWPAGLRDIERRDTPASPFDDDTAMALILAEELLAEEVDLRRLADRWIGWLRTDGRGAGAWTRTALEHIARHDSPPAGMSGPATSGAVMRCLPVALATYASPRNLVSGTWHTAALTHPDPRCAWGAVAVNVAAARFLAGRRDFVPDVIEALRANDAPAELLAAVRRVPLERLDEVARNATADAPVLLCVETALWAAYHAPVLEEALLQIVALGGDADTHAAVAGGLLGLRDGEDAVPPRWVAALPQVEHLRTVAGRLVGAAETSGATGP